MVGLRVVLKLGVLRNPGSAQGPKEVPGIDPGWQSTSTRQEPDLLYYLSLWDLEFFDAKPVLQQWDILMLESCGIAMSMAK